VAKKKKIAKKTKKTAARSRTARVMSSIEAGASKLAQQIEGLFSSTPAEITAAIKADHEALRNFLGVLKDTDRDMKSRRDAYAQFSALLKSHTIAEENALYKPTEKLPGHEMHTKVAEGYVEHGLSDDLMKRIDRERNPLKWSAHANVLSEIVEHHLKEEERDLLPLIDQIAPTPVKDKMLKKFVALRASTQKKVTAKNAGVLKA
jgi:hemerythrin-like domain-containing protein